MERENGFYFVKYDGNWDIAKWDDDLWIFFGREQSWSEDITEVGSKIELP